jgi:threonine synthase
MYISTRGNFESVTVAQAIRYGMVPAGGLFVPARIPGINREQLPAMRDYSYQQLALRIMTPFLDGFSEEEIEQSVMSAYNREKFGHPRIAPLHRLNDQIHFLELWHGPTAAFKDMALQIMPFLLASAKEKTGSSKETVILVATSGDTGKAALEGFKDVPGIRIIVFYPHGGVSKVQELQMVTTDGRNTRVVAVRGNFDDCQTAVKEVFANEPLKKELAARGFELSSANSINWGRLLPQIVYYFWAYLQLLQREEILPDEKVNFVVPTGNFGNILAGWYARRMGLPVQKLICASNENKVLTDFFHSGVYNSNREFKQTSSPSMDILISSNLERFLFEVTGHDAGKIKQWMEDLKEKGFFEVDSGAREKMAEVIAADFADENETLEAIKNIFDNTGYLIDTHTAVGYQVYQKYLAGTGDRTKTVIVSTASPFKFCGSVLAALSGPSFSPEGDELAMLHRLSSLSGIPIHPCLQDLEQKPVLHHEISEKHEVERGTVLRSITSHGDGGFGW